MRLTGLEIKSSVPDSTPRSMSPSSVRAVTMMIGTSRVSGSLLSLRQTSKPLIRGIITSRRIRSGGRAATLSSASTPSTAVSTPQPSVSRYATSSSRFCSLSSTTSTVLSLIFSSLVLWSVRAAGVCGIGMSPRHGHKTRRIERNRLPGAGDNSKWRRRITRAIHSLSALRSRDHPRTTQDSLAAVGQLHRAGSVANNGGEIPCAPCRIARRNVRFPCEA